MKNKIVLIVLFIFITTNLSAKEYHVSKQGNDLNSGSLQSPFLTINQAVKFAFPGDTITVHAGTYREWVKPLQGGTSDLKRIVYRAAPGERVEIKGSEVITGWRKEKNGVWKVIIPNTFFGNYNPYQELIHGDWFIDNDRIHHTGEVFINGKSLYEKETIEKVRHPVAINNSSDPIGSTYTWYCESNATHTTIWVNFQKYNPNKELVEISTRKTCFYPEKPGLNYITIKGFHFSQAATQWAAPTAEQVGMISTHWNKGWIIENNVISDSKTNGITLGKERGTGHNTWTADAENINRDGNIHYIEVVFNVLRNNWNKEHVGTHIVRNNTIYNCEQTAICGSMGAVFSTIENNHIYNIYTKRQFKGYEMAGIKLHAPVDVTIKNNRIHDAGRGIWLDWMVQGARVSSNLLYRNDMDDLLIEVSHGPYIVDNNILLSETAIVNWSQGGAYIHNLITGNVKLVSDKNRFTPYFLPHSIDMAGLTTIHGGDDRFYNNIFTTADSNGLSSAYESAELPSWLYGNVYFNQKESTINDSHNEVHLNYNPTVKLLEKEGDVYLQFSVNKAFLEHRVELISTQTLGVTKIVKTVFDHPNGSEIIFNVDYFGINRSNDNPVAGPFSTINMENGSLKIWNSKEL
ncbi:right-handed parallel beta-helix repeat-containing protein [Aureibaculum luteum]|uniref:right-handed parallel beta-helix repeat-containing protein n=1 Tax=Aureibaculum luteum TaxID=1548456 RepID=UPI000E4FD543|nr:right-handed parallel beta-helix repeat-containing protein [Aureibaculum luteum]